jgi:hypothetical protein
MAASCLMKRACYRTQVAPFAIRFACLFLTLFIASIPIEVFKCCAEVLLSCFEEPESCLEVL